VAESAKRHTWTLGGPTYRVSSKSAEAKCNFGCSQTGTHTERTTDTPIDFKDRLTSSRINILRNQSTVIEKSNRHRTKLTLFTWVNGLCMPTFTVSRKGTAKFCTKTNDGLKYDSR